MLPAAKFALKVTLPPKQNDVALNGVIMAVGAAFTFTTFAVEVLEQPFAVTVQVYDPDAVAK